MIGSARKRNRTEQHEETIEVLSWLLRKVGMRVLLESFVSLVDDIRNTQKTIARPDYLTLLRMDLNRACKKHLSRYDS